MTRTKGPMRWAGVFAAASAALHVLALVISGFGSSPVMLVAYAAIYAILAYGLLRGMRWVGYIAFVVLLIGISVSVSGVWSTGPVPSWLFGAIAATHVLAVLCLFVALWKPAEVPAA